jgi:hypothetical protein
MDVSATALPLRNHCGARKRKREVVGGLNEPPCVSPNHKHGSLLHFPSSFANCINSGDFASLDRLIRLRADVNCEYFILNIRLCETGFIGALNLLNEMYPDNVVRFYSSKVVGCAIVSEATFTCTDNVIIRTAVAPMLPSPVLVSQCSGPRVDSALLMRYLESVPLHSREEVKRELQDAEDVVVEGTARLTVTFDPNSKKVTSFRINYEFESLTAV